MELTLYRYKYGIDDTQGILQVEGIYAGDTLELPWKNNAHNISCIPEGEYKVKSFYSERNLDCIEVLDVPGRLGIEIHSGNYVSQILGCILIGVKCDVLLQNSRETLKKIISLIEDKDAVLRIKKL